MSAAGFQLTAALSDGNIGGRTLLRGGGCLYSTISIALKVEPQSELELPVGPGTDCIGYRLGQSSIVAASRGKGIGLTRLNYSACVRQSGLRSANGSVIGDLVYGAIKDVVTLCAEFEVHLFPDHELLGQGQVELVDARAAQRIARQVAVRSRLRHREGCGVNVSPSLVVEIRIHTGNQIGPCDISALAASRNINQGRGLDHPVRDHRASCNHARRVVSVNNGRPGD